MNFTKSYTTLKILLCGAFVLVELLSLSSISLAQHSPWTTKTDMPTARLSMGTAVVDGKIYAIGGGRTENLPLSAVEVYDPTTNNWDTKTPMPTARGAFGCAVVDGKIYAIGGGLFGPSPLSKVEVYDPVTDSWDDTTKAPMPTARSAVEACTVNGKIYVIGGTLQNSYILEGTSIVEEYDPATNSWTTKANKPTPTWGLRACVLEGKIYVAGGNIKWPNISAVLEVYDPVKDEWITKSSMLIPKYSHSICAFNENIYSFGGWNNCSTGPFYTKVEIYNSITDKWTQTIDIPLALGFLSAVAVGDKIYIMGGTSTLHPFRSVKNVYEYTPHLDLFEMILKAEVDKSLVKPGIDSVCITTRMNDTTGITLLALINDPDGNSIDSLQLYDDGTHDDGNTGDSLYANVWPVPADEAQYYVDIRVTRIESDTVIHQFKNLTSFTTDGLVAYAGFEFVSDDTIFDPDENQPIKLTLKNNSTTTSAKNITAKITSTDTLVITTSGFRTFGDIAAGENSTSEKTYWIYIPSGYQPNTQIDFIIEIASDGYIFWTDIFSIVVAPTTTNTEDIKKSIIRIYPNPAGDQIHIELSENSSGNTHIEVFDLSGKVLQKATILDRNSLSHTVNLSDYRKGIYFIRISNDEYTVTEKIIKVE